MRTKLRKLWKRHRATVVRAQLQRRAVRRITITGRFGRGSWTWSSGREPLGTTETQYTGRMLGVIDVYEPVNKWWESRDVERKRRLRLKYTRKRG